MMRSSPWRSRERNCRVSTKVMDSLIRGNGIPKRIKRINIIRVSGSDRETDSSHQSVLPDASLLCLSSTNVGVVVVGI